MWSLLAFMKRLIWVSYIFLYNQTHASFKISVILKTNWKVWNLYYSNGTLNLETKLSDQCKNNKTEKEQNGISLYPKTT